MNILKSKDFISVGQPSQVLLTYKNESVVQIMLNHEKMTLNDHERVELEMQEVNNQNILNNMIPSKLELKSNVIHDDSTILLQQVKVCTLIKDLSNCKEIFHSNTETTMQGKIIISENDKEKK